MSSNVLTVSSRLKTGSAQSAKAARSVAATALAPTIMVRIAH